MANTKTKPEASTNGLWPTLTVKFAQVEAVIERATVGHRIQAVRIGNMLPDKTGDIEDSYRDVFLRMATQTRSLTGLDIAFPDSGAGADAWQQAYRDFLRMDDALVNEFFSAFQDVDQPYGKREYWPTHALTEDEAKNRASAG